MEEERNFLVEREREAHKEAERASRLREEFLAVVSHELRTPLNSVLGWSQIQEYGATVDLAPCVMGALERLNEKVHDLIISDIGMPDMDGYEFMRRVRSGGAKIPAIAVTAFANSADRAWALQAGYSMHFAKPLESQELIKAVAALLRPGY